LSAPDQATVLALDLTDAIDVSWIPEGLSSTVEQTLVIEGVDHQVTFGGAYVVTFQLSQPLQTTAFILDDATYGVLDQSLLSF
jgi:predicted GNAT superfamily acetyltransferase